MIDTGIYLSYLMRECQTQGGQIRQCAIVDLADRDLTLLAPYRWRSPDPWPRFRWDLSRWRERIDTIFGQLVERRAVKRVSVRDRWHLANLLLRNVLMHTLAIFTNLTLQCAPLQLADLVAWSTSTRGQNKRGGISPCTQRPASLLDSLRGNARK